MALKCSTNNLQVSRVANNVEIEACLGADVAKYAANKQRGGSNGNKGTRYEDHFIATKVVETAVAWLEGLVDDKTHIQGQVYGFVDDARIASQEATNYFQLKNKEAVSWTSGDHPLATDFLYQVKLSAHLKEPKPSTALVVSSSGAAEELRTSIPDDIKPHTSVHHFPWCQTANRLVLECVELRERLAKLVHLENATPDTLYGVFCMLQMACIEKPEGATIQELLDCASKISPCQLRLTPISTNWEEHLLPDVHNVLAQIDGLQYGAKRGFFYWSGFNTSGIFEANVLSEEFRDFQNNIVQFKPKTFEEFERLIP